MVNARISAYDPNSGNGLRFLQLDEVTKSMLIFSVSSQTFMSPDFYQKVFQMVPLLVDIHLGYVGNSSVNTVAILRAEGSDDTLVTNVNQFVLVDKQTRRPSSAPDWWLEKYKPTVVENRSLVINRLDIPSEGDAYKYLIRVPWSDIDGNKHTHFSSYTKFCFDAAMDAVDKNYFSVFSGDILMYDVKSFSQSFFGESEAGDEIEISTWQDRANPLILHFSFDKKDKVIFQSSIEFHDNASSNL